MRILQAVQKEIQISLTGQMPGSQEVFLRAHIAPTEHRLIVPIHPEVRRERLDLVEIRMCRTDRELQRASIPDRRLPMDICKRQIRISRLIKQEIAVSVIVIQINLVIYHQNVPICIRSDALPLPLK